MGVQRHCQEWGQGPSTGDWHRGLRSDGMDGGKGGRSWGGSDAAWRGLALGAQGPGDRFNLWSLFYKTWTNKWMHTTEMDGGWMFIQAIILHRTSVTIIHNASLSIMIQSWSQCTCIAWTFNCTRLSKNIQQKCWVWRRRFAALLLFGRETSADGIPPPPVQRTLTYVRLMFVSDWGVKKYPLPAVWSIERLV